MENVLQQILEKLNAISNDITDIKEKMATREEVKAVANSLEMIATGEVAATRTNLEDKIESGDVLNKSLIDGLENRLTEVIEEGFDRMEQGIGNLSQVTVTILENQQNTANVLNMLLERFETQDEIINLFDQRLKKLENTTRNLRQAIRKLGGDVS